jgi:hypothetical protein
MAGLLGSIRNGSTLLEPVIGSDALACAATEQPVEQGHVDRLLVGFETDAELIEAAETG